MHTSFYGPPIGAPKIEVEAPPIAFPLPAVPATFAPTWPPSVDETNPLRASAEQTSKIVDVMLDRKAGAPMLLRDAFRVLFEKLDRPSDNANTDLIAELLDFKGRVTARLEGQRADHLAAAKAAHAAVFSQCRQAKDVRDRLQVQVNEAQGVAQGIQLGRLALGKASVADTEGSRPSRETYPTPEELAGWWERVTAERVKLAAAQREYETQMGVVARLQRELAAAEAEFQRLSQQEQDLAAKAENRPSRMLGVEVPAPLQEL
jgi:hypothetical protein